MTSLRKPFAALLVAAAALTACAPQDGASDTGASAPGTAGGCAPGALATRTAGTLTVGTDKPAYDPWFSEDEPGTVRASSRRWRTRWPRGWGTRRRR